MTIRQQHRLTLVFGLSLVMLLSVPIVSFAQAKPAPAKPAPAKPAATPAKANPVATLPPTPTEPPSAAFEKIEKLYQEGKYQQTVAAARQFQKVYWFSGLQQGAMYYEGWAAFSLKQYADALNAFETLIKSYSSSDLVPEALLKKAECLKEMKEYDKALQIYASFSKKFPKHRLEGQSVLGTALTLFAKKDFTGAKQNLARYRDLFPVEWRENFQGLFLYAQILNEEKNYQEAQATYEAIAARTDNPLVAEGIYLGAQNLFDAKQYTQALSFFKRVPPNAFLLDSVDRQLATLTANRAAIIAQRGLSGFNAQVQALQTLRNQWQSRPDLRPSALYRIANCYQLLGRAEEAGVVYQHLMERYSTNAIAEQAHYGFIETLMDRKRMAQANKEIEIFKTKYPTSALFESTTIRQAEALFNTKRFEEAMPLYRQAKESTKEPRVIEAADFRLALCLLELGQYDKAVTALGDFVTAHPESKAIPEVIFRQGRCYFELSRATTDQVAGKDYLVKATECFETIRTKYPELEILPDVTFQLGYLYVYLAGYDAANYDTAITVLQGFIQNWPNHRLAPEVLYLLARTYSAQQKYADSIETYNKLTQQFPEDPKAPLAAFESASLYSAAGKPDEMVGALKAFAEKYPDNPRVGDALYTIADQLERAGNRLLTDNNSAGAAAKFKEAEAVYQQVITQATNAPEGEEGKSLRDAAIGAQIKLVALQEQRNAVEEAVAGCKTFIGQFADYPVASRQIVNQISALYRKAKQPDKAYAVFEELRTKYQSKAGVRIAALTAIAELAIAEGDNLRANQATAQLLADPESDKLPAITYIAIGETLLKTEQCDRARDAYLKMQAAFPNDPSLARQAVLGLGRAALCQKQYDEAEKWFRQLADTPPVGQNAEAELGLARVAESRGKLTEAVNRYNSVLKLSRSETGNEAAFRLGLIFYNLKEADPKKSKDNAKAALAYFARLILSTGPMAEEAFFMLGACHERIGSPDWARAGYQNYLKRFPDGKFTEKAKERLKQIAAPAK